MGLLAAVLVVLGLAIGPGSPAAADDGAVLTVSIVQRDPNTGQYVSSPVTQPTGSTFSYSVSLSCGVVTGTTCLTGGVVTIPLDPELLDDDGALRPAFRLGLPASMPGGVTGIQVEGGAIVTTLADIGAEGATMSIPFSIAAANGLPDGTSWSLTPTVTSAADDEVEGNTIVSVLSASKAAPSLAKNATKSGVQPGEEAWWRLRVTCFAGTSGEELPTSMTITDQLPAGLSFDHVQVEPFSWDPYSAYQFADDEIVYDPGTVTLVISDPVTFCGAGGTSPSVYLVTTVPDDAEVGAVYTNTATLSGAFADGTTTTGEPVTATTTVIPPPPVSVTFNKDGYGPVDTRSTWAGRWTNLTTVPRTTIQSAVEDNGTLEAYYRVGAGYIGMITGSAVVAESISDNLPCLDNGTPPYYNISAPEGTLCQHPAFHPTVVEISTPYAASNVPADYAPIATLTDGSTLTLPRATSPSSGNYTRWSVPTGAIEQVARIEFPPLTGTLTTTGTSFYIGGYADGSIPAGAQVQNTARHTAVFQNDDGTTSTYTDTDPGSVTIIGGASGFVDKSMYYDEGSDSLQAYLYPTFRVPAIVGFQAPIVVADLWPAGSVPDLADGTSVTWNVAREGYLDACEKENEALAEAGEQELPCDEPTVTVATEVIPDYSDGRTLLRWTIPVEPLNKVLPATGIGYRESGVELSLDSPLRATHPDPGSYTNDALVFAGPTSSPTELTCTIRRAADTANLDGDDGTTYGCAASATASKPFPAGAAFKLQKQVRTSLDGNVWEPSPSAASVPADGGSASFRLIWSNMAATPLIAPVLYDILPHPGDTGTTADQQNAERGSDFGVTFAGLDPGAALPDGVTVAYSASANPCRPELASPNPTIELPQDCVDDWSADYPIDPETGEPNAGLVLALRISSTATYAPGQGVSVTFSVTSPTIESTEDRAWNTVAAAATPADDSYLAPVESPKVGLRGAFSPDESGEDPDPGNPDDPGDERPSGPEPGSEDRSNPGPRGDDADNSDAGNSGSDDLRTHQSLANTGTRTGPWWLAVGLGAVLLGTGMTATGRRRRR